MKIGFLGLGNMGAPMATNLARNNYDVRGFDIAAPCPAGIVPAPSGHNAVGGQDLVFTMLPGGRELRQVAEDILPHMGTGTIWVDCSTVEIEAATETARRAAKRGVTFLDAPVSGGITGARAGTLTIMVGGPAAAFSRVRPVLEVVGGRIVHCGKVGAGQSTKICNNLILAPAMVATCEAFALADRLGLDLSILFEVVSKSSGYSWSSNAYTPLPGIGTESPADHGYQAGFAARLMLKDLLLAEQAAESVNFWPEVSMAAKEYYRRFVEEKGKGELDFSAVMLELMAGNESNGCREQNQRPLAPTD